MTRERAFRFGRSRHLIGVAGLPAAAQNTVGVIVLNAGMMHRVGPFRLHVEMTRRLNALGYATLRFDLSTLGDSGASAESQTREQQIRADVSDAMAMLGEQSGCTEFVLIGLCRGAQSAHTAAVTEPKIVGAVFLDGYIYRSMGFMLRHYFPRLFSASRWRHFIFRSMQRNNVADEAAFGSVYPPKAQVRTELVDMIARGLKLHFIYSGGISEQLNHPRQFRESFGRVADDPSMSFELLRGTDHTYTLVCDRERMLGRVECWMHANFPGGRAISAAQTSGAALQAGGNR